jgi:hypothetical protein
MATSIKISQLPAKGANLEATDLLEVSEFNGTGYVSKSITGQEIIDAVAGSGVTDVTASAPLASSGGTTPDISIPQADAGSDGYLSSTDYISFTNKQDALVSGTNIKTINGSSVLGSGDLVVSGGGASGIHSFVKPQTGDSTSASINAGALSTIAISNNRLYANPFIPVQSITCSSLYVSCSTSQASSLGRILIYSDLNGLPNTKLYESANLDLSVTGIKTATTTFTFTAGTTYWLSFHGSGTASIHSISVGNVIPLRISSISVNSLYIATTAPAFGSAPSPFGAVSGTNTTVPFIGITL